MIKNIDEDIVPKEDRRRILDEIAVEKGFKDYADFKKETAIKIGYSGWEEFLEAIQRKRRIEEEKYNPKRLSHSMRRFYYFFYNAGIVNRYRLREVVFKQV